MKKPRFSLGGKLIIAFIIVVVGATSIPIVYELTYLFNHIYDEARRKMDSDVEIASLVFDKHETMLLRIARTMSRDIYIGKILAYPSDPRSKTQMVKGRVANFLTGFTEHDLSYIIIADSNGTVLYPEPNLSDTIPARGTADPIISTSLKGRETTGYNVRSIKEMWENGLVNDAPPPGDSRKALILEAAIPIVVSESDAAYPMQGQNAGQSSPPSPVGVVLVGYQLNNDFNMLQEIKQRTRCAASIYSPDSLVNTTEHNWISLLSEDFFKNPDAARRKILTYPSRGEIGGYLPLKTPDGGVAAVFELRSSTVSTYEAWRRSLRNSIIFTAFGISVAVLLGILFTRRITGAVNILRQGTEEIGRGNLSHRIALGGKDELAQLAEGFNLMAIRLKRGMEEMRLGKQQVDEYSARLKSAHVSLEMYSHELEKVNQALLDSNIKLQKANEVKDTFLSTVSHELKTPLTTILGYVSMILEGALGGMTSEQRQAFEVVQRRGKNLQDLISDLLALSRLDAGKLELRRRYVDAGQELHNLEEVFTERLKECSLQIMLSIQDNLPRVNADSERFNQVLYNLVGNAIKFTPPGGTITVRASHPADANHIVFSVSDTGIGIPASELSHIFERFYQVDRRESREFPGTGLGLSISKELVELHGGRIWVESREGQGSTFHFTLPL